MLSCLVFGDGLPRSRKLMLAYCTSGYCRPGVCSLLGTSPGMSLATVHYNISDAEPDSAARQSHLNPCQTLSAIYCLCCAVVLSCRLCLIQQGPYPTCAFDSMMQASGTHQSQQQVQGRAQPPHSERESASSQGRSESSSSRHTDAHSNSMQLFKRRQSSLGPNTATHVYRGGVPLHIVRGQGCHLYCSDGTEYLDCVNNVAHVGHCHPEVGQPVSKALLHCLLTRPAHTQKTVP